MLLATFIAVAMLFPRQDAAVEVREPLPPAEQSLAFDARCPAGLLRLEHVATARPLGRKPMLKVAGKPVSLPAGFAAYADTPGAAYRVSVVCPRRGAAFQLQLYRATAADGARPAGDVWTLNVNADATVVDRGRARLDPDGFWFR